MRNDSYQRARDHQNRGNDQLQSQSKLDTRLGSDRVDVGSYKGGEQRDQDACERKERERERERDKERDGVSIESNEWMRGCEGSSG